MEEATPDRRAPRESSAVSAWRTGPVLGATALLAAAILAHTPGVNGPDYWQWTWRRLPLLPVLALSFACAIPVLAGQVLLAITARRRRVTVAVSLLLAMGSSALLQLVLPGLDIPEPRLSRVARIIAHEEAMSYFSDAARLRDHEEILAHYPELLEQELRYHSRTKPPGPLLLNHTLIRWLGPGERAATTAGLLIALLALAGIPAVYLLFRSLGAGQTGAVCAAGIMSLCTGPVVFMPAFDQLYPIVTCLLLGSWALALERDRVAFSLLCGLVLAAGTFFAYHFLVLGAFFLLLALLKLDRDQASRASLLVILRHALVVASVWGLCYGVLWLASGFDPFESFRSVLSNQEMSKAIFASRGQRLYPFTIVPDLVDLALGMSWLPLLTAPVLLIARWRRSSADQRSRVAWLCLLQVALVAVSGQLAAETARVWIFLMPLVLYPLALELERWRLGDRLVLLACTCLLLALNVQNMVFIRL